MQETAINFLAFIAISVVYWGLARRHQEKRNCMLLLRVDVACRLVTLFQCSSISRVPSRGTCHKLLPASASILRGGRDPPSRQRC